MAGIMWVLPTFARQVPGRDLETASETWREVNREVNEGTGIYTYFQIP